MPDNYSTANFAVQKYSGQTTAQTWKDRLRLNVKDFGAVGDATNDDTTSIQNAINAAIDAQGGEVYFPIGEYKVTTPIVFSHGTPYTGNRLVKLVGEKNVSGNVGPGSKIRGTVNGFIFDNNDINVLNISGTVGVFVVNETVSDNPLSQGTTYVLLTASSTQLTCHNGSVQFTGLPISIKGNTSGATATLNSQIYPQWVLSRVESLYIENTHASAGTGCIKLNGTQTASIVDCYLKGMTGLSAISNSFQVAIRDTFLQGPSGVPAGSIGIAGGPNAHNCNFIGWDNAYRHCGNEGSAIGCRFEVNNFAVRMGVDDNNVSFPSNGFVMLGCATEKCNTDVSIFNATAIGIYSNSLTGTVGQGQANRDYGIRLLNTLQSISIIGNASGGSFNHAAYSFSGADMFPNCNNIVVIGNTANAGVGANWDVSGFTDASQATGSRCNQFFLAGNNVAGAMTCTVAHLPTNAPLRGDRMLVTDANAVTYNSIVAAGGANVVPVFYDGTNWRIG